METLKMGFGADRLYAALMWNRTKKKKNILRNAKPYSGVRKKYKDNKIWNNVKGAKES